MGHRVVAATLAVLLVATLTGIAVAMDPVDLETGGIPIPDGVDDGHPLPAPDLPDGPVLDGPDIDDAAVEHVPAGARLIPAPRPDSTSATSLLGYLLQQRERLSSLASDEAVLAAVTLRRPMPLADFRVFLSKAGVSAEYVEWQVPDSPNHGGTSWLLIEALQKRSPSAEVTYFSVVGSSSDLQLLSTQAEIWLVDLGSGPPRGTDEPTVQALPKNYFHDAEELGILSK
jgi:hypothetical protein